MKKKLMKIMSFTFVLISVFTTSIYASDNNLKFNESELLITSENNIQPRWSWPGTAYLSNESYCNITTYNNFWKDSPKVTNGASNKYSITVRAINEKGEIVCPEQTILPGETVKLNRINAFEGKITFQGKSTEKGDYYISLT